MVKYCIPKYPKGYFPYQKTSGQYMEGYLYSNLQILARAIVKDMTFMGIIFSSTLEVGTGKSVLAQQIADAYTEMVNNYHGLSLEFTERNIVFTPKDLIERSFEVPKYSCIILDEWEDSHYWSELGMTLRQFFRKCRQLNLFMLVIIPNFFQLPISYAVSRSVFAIDVQFTGEYDRGFFKFYGFEKKKELYNKGKRGHNYDVVRRDFDGAFNDGYAIPREVYLRVKRRDLERAEKQEAKKKDEKEITRELIKKIYLALKDKITQIDLANALAVSDRTINNWVTDYNTKKPKESAVESEEGKEYSNITTGSGDDGQGEPEG